MKALLKFDRYKIAILGYALIAFSTAIFHQEVRPFFNGKWFYHTPVTMSDFGLLVTELNQNKFSEPVYLESIAEKSLRAWKFDAYVMTQKLGITFNPATGTIDEAALENLRRAVIRDANIKMILQKRNYDMLEFIDHNKVTTTENMKVIEFGK